jgi:hypothetical protein
MGGLTGKQNNKPRPAAGSIVSERVERARPSASAGQSKTERRGNRLLQQVSKYLNSARNGAVAIEECGGTWREEKAMQGKREGGLDWAGLGWAGLGRRTRTSSKDVVQLALCGRAEESGGGLLKPWWRIKRRENVDEESRVARQENW